MLLNRNPNVPKQPQSIFYLNYLIYVIPVFAFVIQLLFVGYLPWNETLKMLQAVSFQVFFWITFLIPVLLYILFMRPILSYDGSEESLVKANKCAKFYPTASLVLPVLINILLPFCLCAEKEIGFANNIGLSLVFTSTGGLFLFSLFFYIIFLQKFETYLKFLPLRKEFTGMSLTVRSSLVAFFALIGSCSVIIAPIISSEICDFKIQTLFLYKVLTFAIIAITLGTQDYFFQAKGTERRLKEL